MTGLMWEVKTDDDSVHDKDNEYSWYDAQDVFVAQVNAGKFGGRSDWRMPTIQELLIHQDAGAMGPDHKRSVFLRHSVVHLLVVYCLCLLSELRLVCRFLPWRRHGRR